MKVVTAASARPRVSVSPRPHAIVSPLSGEVSDLQRALRDVRILRQGGLSIPRLLFSREEAEAIMAVAPAGEGMKATDFKASRATATSPELGQYRIVHFATHGLLNSEHPELSGLVFSLVDEQGKHQDGFLRLHDIYNLNLPVDLVVLSACNTGLGKDVRGEGLVGIVRGFMYAGAARVVASLWKVDDEATAELMKRFYQQMLQDGMSTGCSAPCCAGGDVAAEAVAFTLLLGCVCAAGGVEVRAEARRTRRHGDTARRVTRLWETLGAIRNCESIRPLWRRLCAFSN